MLWAWRREIKLEVTLQTSLIIFSKCLHMKAAWKHRSNLTVDWAGYTYTINVVFIPSVITTLTSVFLQLILRGISLLSSCFLGRASPISIAEINLPSLWSLSIMCLPFLLRVIAMLVYPSNYLIIFVPLAKYCFKDSHYSCHLPTIQ